MNQNFLSRCVWAVGGKKGKNRRKEEERGKKGDINLLSLIKIEEFYNLFVGDRIFFFFHSDELQMREAGKKNFIQIFTRVNKEKFLNQLRVISPPPLLLSYDYSHLDTIFSARKIHFNFYGWKNQFFNRVKLTLHHPLLPSFKTSNPPGSSKWRYN